MKRKPFGASFFYWVDFNFVHCVKKEKNNYFQNILPHCPHGLSRFLSGPKWLLISHCNWVKCEIEVPIKRSLQVMHMGAVKWCQLWDSKIPHIFFSDNRHEKFHIRWDLCFKNWNIRCRPIGPGFQILVQIPKYRSKKIGVNYNFFLIFKKQF